MKRKTSSKETKLSIKKGKINKADESVAHYASILVEDLRSDFKFVIEKVDGMETRLNQRIDGLKEEMNARFDVVEGVLEDHSRILQEHERLLTEHSGMLAEIQQELKENRESWKKNEERWQKNEERWQKNEERWQKNEERLDRIETGLGGVVEKVTEHQADIQNIKEVVNL